MVIPAEVMSEIVRLGKLWACKNDPLNQTKAVEDYPADPDFVANMSKSYTLFCSLMPDPVEAFFKLFYR